MSIETLTVLLATALGFARPLIFAGIGELVTEKSGVLNLGVEGLMLTGAIGGFITTLSTQSLGLGLFIGGLSGAILALIFAFLCLHLMTNQVATGLALAIFGVGLSAFIGKGYVGQTVPDVAPLSIPLLSDIPLLGQSLFALTLPAYLAIAIGLVTSFVFSKTRIGLMIRAVGESPDSAHAIGYDVRLIRYCCTLFGGFMCGLGGAYIALIQNKFWVENMTAGIGWVALALVVFSTWRPFVLMISALFFGAISGLGFILQASGLEINTQFLASLPYLSTIIVLCIISSNPKTIKLNAPVSLGKSFFR